MKNSLVVSLSLIHKNLKQIGVESIENCKHPDPVIAKQFYEINKLAKSCYDLLDKDPQIKKHLKNKRGVTKCSLDVTNLTKREIKIPIDYSNLLLKLITKVN